MKKKDTTRLVDDLVQAYGASTISQVLDAFNNLVTGDTSNVTVAIGTNAGGGTLSGITTVPAVGGIATFSTLSIDKTGTGYTLSAADGSLTSATSTGFNITPAAAHHLGFGVQPTTR